EQDQFLSLLPQHATIAHNSNKKQSLYWLLNVNNLPEDKNNQVWVPLIPVSLPLTFERLNIDNQSSIIIDQLHEELERTSSESTNSTVDPESVSDIIDQLINKGKLGSSVLVSTNLYLELVLNQLCPMCGDKEITSRKHTIKVVGLTNVAKIEARNQARAQKIINQKACLGGFNFDQDLVPYGQIVQQSLETMQFHPSFATKISNFKTIIKCGVYQNKDKDKPDSKNRMLDAIVSEVFNFTEFRPKQRESIDSFTAGNDTLCLKQQELVNMGIPSAMLYASSEQSPDIQEVIFSEIASGFTRILLVTPEKYIKNPAFSRMLQNISCKQQLQFVIDEAHCINQYVYFQNDWAKLNLLKRDFPSSPILLLTATCGQTNAQMIKDNLGLLDLKVFRSSTISRPEIRLEVLNKPAQKENQTKILLDLVQSNFPNRCIVYSATIDDCDTYYNILAKHFGLNIVEK
ncbi:5457_t:CDS:2, partial [Gigaspora rosea]